MARAFPAVTLATLGLAAALAGCAPGAVIDKLPGEVGLPAGAPARPATAYQYPAVHDMPPPRSATPLSEEEQVKLEKDLAATRDRQAREATEDPDKKAAAPPPPPKTQAAKGPAKSPTAKKKPAEVIVVPPAGAKANP
ncbi:MAG: hypothetical protein HY244_02220 [Rhizobiales bacterium]|nr:hypothetical protein [Hyphomicrobiales bacterium]